MTRTLETVPANEMNSGGGNYLNDEGFFHLRVIDVKDGQMPNGNHELAGFSVTVEVVGGEHAGKGMGRR